MTSEALIQRCILAELQRRGIFVWRANSGQARTATGGFMRFNVEGCADLIGVLPGGRFLAVEIKSPKGRQSEAQRMFQERVTRSGGLYVLARSVEDVLTALPVEARN